MHTKTRLLLLQEQTDQCLQCLLFHLPALKHNCIIKEYCSNFKTNMEIILGDHSATDIITNIYQNYVLFLIEKICRDPSLEPSR